MSSSVSRDGTLRGTISRLVASPIGGFPLLAIFFILVVGAGVLYARTRLQHAVRTQLASQLEVTRSTSVAAVTLWLGAARQTADLVMSDHRIAAHMRHCLAIETACDGEALMADVRPFVAALRVRDLVLVNRQGRVRAIDGARRAAWQPPSELVLAMEQLGPQSAVLPAAIEAGAATLWIGAPVVIDGTRAGVMLFELAIESLDEMLQVARTGRTGETYAFDRQGRFLSQSRFAAQLREAGLLGHDDASTALSVEVRDPGVDLTRGERSVLPRAAQPLTRMARDAVAGGHGVDVSGYRDYRGIEVVGAWQWIPELGLGVATEVDAGEAFAATSRVYDIFKWVFAILGASCLALVVGALFLGRLRARAARAQAVADRFGQYRLVRRLAEGGMGALYLADHELLRRPAVVKLVRPDRVTPEAVSRFELEAQVTSTLAHPNTIAIYDYGHTDDGTPYLVMEYVRGLDLERLVRRFGPLPEARVIHVLRQLCGSLAEAHAARLVHRDIKPANLMMCQRTGAPDTLKVLDFGIARTFASVASGHTVRRTLLGTPEYMAPELFDSSANASPQSDLYAVGCVAYFLLTATHVFENEEVGRAHLLETPQPPSKRRGTPVDSDLETAILACLAKRADSRPRSATALRDMLERAASAHPWSEAHAEAWWSEHGDVVEMLNAEREALARPATQRRVRPHRA